VYGGDRLRSRLRDESAALVFCRRQLLLAAAAMLVLRADQVIE